MSLQADLTFIKNNIVPFSLGIVAFAAGIYVEVTHNLAVKTERAALERFRATLQERNDWQGRIQRVYTFCYATVLMIPVIRVVALYVNSFFTYFIDQVVHAVPHRLWAAKKMDELIADLEKRMQRKTLSWSPPFLHKQAPKLSLRVLPELTKDLTRAAEQGELPTASVDVKLLNQLATTFGSSQKKTPLLVGAFESPTSIAEGLAQKIVDGNSDLPSIFKKRRVFLFNWSSLGLAPLTLQTDVWENINIRTKAETTLKSILNEALAQKEGVILMIEFDGFSSDYAEKESRQLLQSNLNSPGLICIGLTTQGNYDKLTKVDSSLASQMTPVNLSAPSIQESQKAFSAKVSLLKMLHSVQFQEEAVQAAVQWGASFCKNRNSFDGAYDFLDIAAARLHLNHAAMPDDLQRSIFLRTLLMLKAQMDDPTKIDQKISQVQSQFSRSVTKELVAAVVAEKIKLPLEQLQETDKELLWSEKKFNPLMTALEKQMTSPLGIVWAPTFFHKKAPVLPKSLPTLSTFARDLTLEAEMRRLRPFFGRNKEIQKIADILGRSQKCNPILIGPPGVGKTAILEGIAQNIVLGDPTLPSIFQNKRIFLIDWSYLSQNGDNKNLSAVDSTALDDLLSDRYGIVKKRLEKILREAADNKEYVIIVIDEIHAFLNTGKGEECMQILKPALANGSIACIGATTPWDYKEILAKDPALERRFPTVEVAEPTEKDMKQVLKAVIPSFEAHHGVQITDQAMNEAINLGELYFKSLSFPDKALDLLDQAASQKSNQALSPQDKQLALFLKRLLQIQSQMDDPSALDQKIAETKAKLSKKVTEELVRQVVAQKVNLPLQRIEQSEKALLSTLETQLGQKIIGQKKAIATLCSGVRRARLKLGNRNRPAGVFLMCGPTGVGKTESIKALAHLLYGSKDNLLRIDMSEYQHSSDISKLIGSPVGYSGHTQGGHLTNWLKKKPLSIVLFDEIEKASPDIFDLLLGLFDAGRLTDGNSQTVSCLDTTLVMTSNIGAQVITDNQNGSEEQLRTLLDQALANKFKPEFIGRIQETVIFYPLADDEVRQIVALQCTELKERVENNPNCPRLKMEWDDSLVQYLAKTYYNPAKGARALASGIQRTMENPIADLMVQEKIKEGDTIRFSSDGTQVNINVSSV